MFFGSDIVGLSTGGSERMRITSTGEVLVGGTTSISANPGALTVQRTDSPPGINIFRNDTSVADAQAIGGIYFYGSDTTSNTPTQLAFVTAPASGTHAAGDNPTDLVFGTTPDNTETVAEAGRITQSGAYVLKGGILNPGGVGITFPATQSASSNANTLDDYEEGTWTPTLASGFSTAPTGYSAQTGNYVKIGKVVYFTFAIDADGAVASAGNLEIGGLPFTVSSAEGFATIYYQASFNTNTGDIYAAGNGTTRVKVFSNAGNARAGNAAGVNINNLIAMAGFYFV
jgi:hypothetical protein